MNIDCPCSSDQKWPRSYLATHRQARFIYILCLIVCFVSMLLIAYTTTYRRGSLKISKELESSSGNIFERNSPFGLHKKTVNIFDQFGETYSSMKNVKFQAPLFYNCSLIDTTSDLLTMKPPKYHPNFKNPCWYEDLMDYDVYKKNKFAEYYSSYKSVFRELSETWRKTLAEETNPRRLRCLPYFFIAGQPKCGSTDLYQKLTSHPDVVSPPIKECHFWGKNRYGWRSNYTSSLSFNDYVDLYDKAALYIDHGPNSIDGTLDYHQRVTGDASVSTLWDNDEWWRLKENCGLTEPKYTNADYVHHFLPDAKIIVILRDPVDRLWSDYLYFQKSMKSPEDFHKHVVTSITFHKKCTSRNNLVSCLYNRTLANLSRVRLRIGIYHAYLENWLSVYPRDQFLILRLEDYAINTKNVMKRVFKFLKLRDLTRAEADYIIGQPVANSRRKGDIKLGTMNEDTRKILQEFYDPYNKQLALLLKDSRFTWKDKRRPIVVNNTTVTERTRRSNRFLRRSRRRLMDRMKKRHKHGDH